MSRVKDCIATLLCHILSAPVRYWLDPGAGSAGLARVLSLNNICPHCFLRLGEHNWKYRPTDRRHLAKFVLFHKGKIYSINIWYWLIKSSNFNSLVFFIQTSSSSYWLKIFETINIMQNCRLIVKNFCTINWVTARHLKNPKFLDPVTTIKLLKYQTYSSYNKLSNNLHTSDLVRSTNIIFGNSRRSSDFGKVVINMV